MQTAAGSLRSAWKFSLMFHCIFLFLLWRICSLVRWFLLKGFFKTKIQSYPESEYGRSVAAVESCFCFIIVAAVIVLELGALFLWFVLLYSQRAASHLYMQDFTRAATWPKYFASNWWPWKVVLFFPGVSHLKRTLVLVRNFEKNPQERYQDPVLLVWHEL